MSAPLNGRARCADAWLLITGSFEKLDQHGTGVGDSWTASNPRITIS
jgi:hypothetical protein